MEQFRRGELVFDVIDAGPADGPVVVLLHGFPELHLMWQPIIDRLGARGYRCLAPLQRGYSAGARPKRRRDYRNTELVGDVAALIEASGAQKVHLVGHDWGAAVAWYVAQEHPDRLSTLTSLSVPHPAAFLKAIATSRQALASWYMLFFQLPWIPERFLSHPRAQKGYLDSRSSPELAHAEVKAIQEPGALTAALNWYRAMPLSNPKEVRRKVDVPTMYVWSDKDIALKEKGARLCADYVTGEYRYEVLTGVSHWILDERPDATAELLLDWFGTHP
ncbi:alpha/beta fold hydrolase [Mycobacterium sp. 1274761.0]|uniref:alpha/beta fold hydrolase n=1 Tax=Mycobacterium sp. 1274761.0 TaxID=1834077 RepID=UPI0007FEE9DF|nr:alpha/beta fold hydrolase [Mycobacterium sp. 1274761.0]OBK79473.1 alpha/beta hydrolase [Mycobacterium sp. 1274761.0]